MPGLANLGKETISASGTGNLFLKGSSTLTVSNGITPEFAAGALDITLD